MSRYSIHVFSRWYSCQWHFVMVQNEVFFPIFFIFSATVERSVPQILQHSCSFYCQNIIVSGIDFSSYPLWVMIWQRKKRFFCFNSMLSYCSFILCLTTDWLIERSDRVGMNTVTCPVEERIFVLTSLPALGITLLPVRTLLDLSLET